MAEDICSLIIVLVVCALWVIALQARQHRRLLDRPAASTTHQRLLKPRTPNDCPARRNHHAQPASALPPTVRP